MPSSAELDDIGFAPLDHTGCQLMFRLIAAFQHRVGTQREPPLVNLGLGARDPVWQDALTNASSSSGV